MLHTPLKHTHPAAVVHHPHGHAPAQQSSPSTRCTPHAAAAAVVHGAHAPGVTHELNLSDWLHMSPTQVAMMSPVAASPYTPPGHHHQQHHHQHHLFVPTPSPLQYAAVANANARNDFLATSSPLTYSSPPFQVPSPYSHHNPYSQYHQAQMQMQVPTIAVSVENMQMHQLQDVTHTVMHPSPSPLNTEYFPYANTSNSASPISHQGSPFPFPSFQSYARPTAGAAAGGEGETTPVTTLSGIDESQARTSSQEKVGGHSQPLIDKLRGASPVTDAGTNGSASPVRPSAQAKPVESTESPFRIAAPQPRTGSGPFSPLPPSSRPASALGALSELAELAASRHPTPSRSQQHTPSPLAPAGVAVNASTPTSRAVSRPTSALSTRSTASHSHLKTPSKSTHRRKLPPPHRFPSSLLRVNLPYSTPCSSSCGSNTHSGCAGVGVAEAGKPLTPSLIDSLPRGPLEFEDEGHRYRTRSKLRSLKAEIQEREREADLMLIRRGLRGDLGEGGEGEDKSGLEMLASVSVTRRIGIDLELNSRSLSFKRSDTPLSTASHVSKARSKRTVKRAFRELEDGDCESVTTASECGGRRTPSKRPRVPSEKKAAAMSTGKAKTKVKKEVAETGTRSLRSRMTSKNGSASAAVTRASSLRGNKPTPLKNVKASTASAPVKKAVTVKEDVQMDLGESELSSLSSMSETEDGAVEDADYAPKKTKSSARGASNTKSSSTKAPTAAQSKSSITYTSSCMPIDTSRGAAAIPFPVRRFPAEVPIHAAFPLLYRKFPVCGFTDPNFLNFTTPMGSPLSSLASSPSPSSSNGAGIVNGNGNGGQKGGEGEVDPPVPPPPSSGHFNAARSADDLYTPRFVRGIGRDKMGLCPICYESPERGGAGKAEWLSMKFSAFNYHMQYAHGISPITALPFSPPIAFCIVPRTPNHKNEKDEMLEGKCHRCGEWAPVEGVKCVEAKLKEIYWWKHAAQCHKGSTIPGEGDVHLDDAVARRVRRVCEAIHARQHPSVPVLPNFTPSKEEREKYSINGRG